MSSGLIKVLKVEKEPSRFSGQRKFPGRRTRRPESLMLLGNFKWLQFLENMAQERKEEESGDGDTEQGDSFPGCFQGSPHPPSYGDTAVSRSPGRRRAWAATDA